MSPRIKWLVLAGCVTVVIGAAAAAPFALSRMESFRVRRVEVRGTRYLAPHEALRQSGIGANSNIFDHAAPWRAALERHPLIMTARIERVVPGTIRISIVEAEPVALIRTPELRPVRAEGQILPVDPASFDLDLPVMLADARAVHAGRIVDARTLEIARTLATIRAAEPALFGWISDASSAAGGGIRLTLRGPAEAQAFVPAMPSPRALRELRLTLADLAARQDITRLIRIDARFNDQVVVKLASTTAAT